MYSQDIASQNNRPISQYNNKQNSLLEEALTYIPGPLPQPIPTLETNLNFIPPYMRNINLYKEIHSYNRKLILEEFAALCDNVVGIYGRDRGKLGVEVQGFYGNVVKMLGEYQGENSLYVRRMAEVKKKEKIQVQVDFVRNVLNNIAISHIEFFGLNINQGMQNPIKIPQRYDQIINENLNKLFQPPPQPNYFQELLLNPQQKHHQEGLINKIEQKAQQTAAYLTSRFNQRHSVDAKQITSRQKNFKPTESVVIFQPFAVSYGSKKKQQPPSSTQTQQFEHQNILNNLVTGIENQQLNGGYAELTNAQFEPQLEFQNWFTNTFSQMTYYESYMMAHMADLIFLHPDRFQIRYIKYDPYLSQLSRQVIEEVINFKSEEQAFKILYESKYKFQQQHDRQPVSLEAEQKSQKDKKSNKITIGKAIGVIQDIYQKAKKQFKKNQKSFSKPNQPSETSFDKKKYMSENQNIIIPNTFKATKNYYETIIRDLQNFNTLIQNTHSPENKKLHGNLFQSIKTIAEQIKHKIVDETLYYHELQSWMAIVIILYKHIAMDKSNNFDYTPFKRRSIIRICKRIFIEQKKINKNKKEKTVKQQNAFKNWPVVLKFLENNRPEILFDAQGSTNQKQVDKILKQLYELIEKKRLFESGFSNLFDGINVKQSLPQIKLVCLSNGASLNENLDKGKTTTQCKVVHILISGFLSEDTDKLEEWSEMVDIMSDSEIYALVWESNTIKNLVKFFLRSAADVISAAKMIDQIRRKYTDNPFNPAFEVAQVTGRILAQLIIRLFPNRFVNVCGYSLGSQVIKQFLSRMIHKKQTHLINNIYIMGGVSDSEAIADLVSYSQSPLSVYNCYTNNDAVLRHLLSLCKPEIKPVGLNQISKVEGHSIINVDCTKFISGHLAFRSNLRLMGEVLELSTG